MEESHSNNNIASDTEPEISGTQEQGQVEGLQYRQSRLEQIMIAFIAVLFIGFAAMFVAVGQMLYDSWTNKQATYQDLRDQVNDQGRQINALMRSIHDQQKN